MFHPLMQKIVAGLPVAESVAELGSQTWQDGQQQRSAEDFYRALGWKRYACYDFDPRWGAVQEDLSMPPPAVEEVDLVTNNGTLEHIFSTDSAFMWAHALCKGGGLMVHVLPWKGERTVNHGFYAFEPVLFRDLAARNGYTIVGLYAGDRNGRMERLDGVRGLDPFHHPKPHEPVSALERVVRSFGERAFVHLVAILKMPEEKPMFERPVQGKYAQVGEQFRMKAPEVPMLLDGGKATYFAEPFPHIVVTDALPADYYKELCAAWPKWQDIVGEGGETDPAMGNTLHQWSAKKIFGNTSLVPEVWRKFMMAHVGEKWLRRLFEAFGDALQPALAQLPQQASLCVRGTGFADVQLDAQFAVNTPVVRESRVRGPHVDSADELIAGLFYMPEEGDDAGGDLVLYRAKEGVDLRLVGKAEVLDGAVEEVARVPYAPNTLLLFANTPGAIHGVGPRKATSRPRRYINFLVNANKVVWPQMQRDDTQSQETLRAAHRR